MFFVICDPGHVSACDVCICSDHMRKWRNLCYLGSDTNTYTCAWWDQTAKSVPYTCAWSGSESLPPWPKTKLTSWRKRKPYPHRDEAEKHQLLSYSIGDPAHRLTYSKTTLIITGIIADVTKAMWMSRYWENVGMTAKATLLLHCLRSGSDCSEIDRADGSRKAEKAIFDNSGRIVHVATKTALNRFWRLLLLWWWQCTNSSWPPLKKIHVDQDSKNSIKTQVDHLFKIFKKNKINACI